MKDRFNKKYSIIILILAIAIITVLLFHLNKSQPAPEGPPQALYYDSLYREYPNPDLINNITTILEQHGYNVTIVLGKNATLDQLENLEKYDLIILRAHGAYNGDPESGRPLGTYIYTGLLYDEATQLYGQRKIDRMLRNGDLALGVVPPPGYTGDPRQLPKYIAVSPQYLEREVKHLRRDAIVIFTGCYGAEDNRLANLFLEKGASVYIAWRGNITWTISDASLEQTLKLLLNGTPPSLIKQELPNTLTEDPFTGATLTIYTRNT